MSTIDNNGPEATTLPIARKRAKRGVKYIRSISQVAEIPADQRALLESVSQQYVFRANDYYLGLIDWTDPRDPIKQLIIPRQEELNEWGKLDASNEEAVTVARGVQHKYTDTVLLLCNEVCGTFGLCMARVLEFTIEIEEELLL